MTMTTTSSTRTILLETILATALVLAVLGVANVPSLGLGVLHPHPIWLVVLVLAARYGARGLVVAIPVAWGVLAVMAAPWTPAVASAASAGAAVAARGAARASWLRSWRATPVRLLVTLAMPAELGALTAAVLVGWVASAHERRERASAEKLGVLERRAGVDSAAIEELRRAALALRARNDRLDLSLTFLRGVARRLEGSDAGAAAEAALELATARLGARAAAVLLVDVGGHGRGDAGDETLAPFAVAGVWSPDGRAVAVDADGTVAAALRSRAPTRAMDLASGGPNDSDLAAPILEPSGDGSGAVRGVLAVRGVPRGGVSVAALRDLAVIAEWSAGALARAKSDRGAPARLVAPAHERAGASAPPPPKTRTEGPAPSAAEAHV
jgi:hypothetical protein